MGSYMRNLRDPELKEKTKPSEEQAIEAVKTLISYIGDNPSRIALIDTPKRVINTYKDFFSGYSSSAAEVLNTSFEDIENDDEMILVKDIRLESHCEHHMIPIIGEAHIAYIPNKKIVGISKLARLVDVFAKRLQSQENLTQQIADAINDYLEPKGVIVLVSAAHQCMTTRGVHKTSTKTTTIASKALFKIDDAKRREFLELIKKEM